VFEGIHRIGELSNDGVFIYDHRILQFTYVNNVFASIFGISKEEVMQHPKLLMPLIRTEDIDYLRHSFSTLLTSKTINNTEFRLQFPDNIIKHLCCDAFLIDDEGLITGILKDITKEKEHEDYITNYGAKKDTLLDMMTHNLSGPLHLTQNILRWTQDTYKEKVPDEISSQLLLVEANTQECVDIVNDFLREEHMESERIYVRKTRFDLLERIVATLDKLVATNKNKKFRLVTDLKNLNITTDSVKFFQAIHNLVSNSIKFTPDGGEIEIHVEERPSTFVVKVKDNGIGIPPELHQHIFQKNTSSKRAGLRNEKSSGIGLYIVKMLVTLMDGKVDFQSDHGNGAVFSIELPKE
jgi:two-component system sensor histidine kinase VicK